MPVSSPFNAGSPLAQHISILFILTLLIAGVILALVTWLGEDTGLLSWVASVDHKQVGLMYLVTTLFFFLVGGVEALLMRIQLAQPGSTFLSPEAYNQIFTIPINEGATISRNLFGTTFFTLTGFHGLHVLIGLVALAILFGLARLGEFKSGPSAALESVALYWHFVDVVWVVIFTVVYLRLPV